MNTKKVIGIALLGVIALGVFGAISWSANRQQPGSAIEDSTQSPATVIPTMEKATVCGETTAWNVLVLGSDAGDLRGEKGSDLTRMLRVDFPNKKVTIYTFPRNLWVDTQALGLTNPSIDAIQLGTVFFEARSRFAGTNNKDGMVEGTNATARMLLENFSIRTDHYLTVDLLQIPAMVDVVGGIPINIPQETTDPYIGMVIPAGQQTLNGEQFIAYARAIPDSDFGRIQRNNLLFDALREKALDPAVWAKIPELFAQFHDVIATDFSPEQINHLACLMKEVPKEAFIQEQVKQEWTSPGPQPGSLLWDKSLVLDQMKELDLIP